MHSTGIPRNAADLPIYRMHRHDVSEQKLQKMSHGVINRAENYVKSLNRMPTEERLEHLKEIVETLDLEKRPGTIAYRTVVVQSTIPNTSGENGPYKPRSMIDQENFMELRRFVNKYREKLFIQSDNKRTMVDKLEKLRTDLAAADQIIFDLTDF